MTRIKIPISRPAIGDEEIEAVTRVLRSGYLAQGSEVAGFERDFADYIGVKHAVAVVNGTVALDLALKAIGIGPSDEVVTTPFTFIATANSIYYQGAKPVFADKDPRTYNLDPESALEAISHKTKAILVVHLYGQPADMEALGEIAEDHKLLLVEDSAQAHGALFMDRKAGSLGDVSIFSFYATKNMTTGEGGMILTDSDKVAERARLMRDHGQTSKYLHEELGYNYRLTDIQAALGRAQLRRLDALNEKRIFNAAHLTGGLSNIGGLETPYVDPRVRHVYHQYVVKVKDDLPITRDQLARELEARGIGTAIHYPLPVHHQPLYRRLGYPQDICPNAIEASKRVLSLPVHPLLNKEDLDYIIRSLREMAGGWG